MLIMAKFYQPVPYLWTILKLTAYVFGTAIVIWAVLWIVSKLIEKKSAAIYQSIMKLYKPVFAIALVLALRLFLPLLQFPQAMNEFAEHTIAIGIIIGIIVLIIQLTDVFNDFIERQYDMTVAENLNARKIHTQLRVLKQIVICLVCLIGIASILMTFERVQQLGASLLASAGVIGVIVGVAAQKTIHTFLTGIQIAITQPIRLDDVVIVEGEWGRIEEITLTYVVVRIWDQRRLIVPITYFIEKPFQNWTRTTAEIIGTIFFYMDYTVPVDAIRTQLYSLVEQSDLWDKKVCGVQVTSMSEKSIEMRVLVSAADASKAWDLRCQIREKMIDFMQQKYPQALPKFRADIENMARA